MRKFLAGLLLILGVTSGFAAEEKGARVAEAETAAQQYMTAFFHGDLRTAASLTHPETLQQIMRAFAQERAAAVAAGKEAEFLAPFGVTATTDLDALGPVDFCVAVISGFRREQPEFAVAAMKATMVSIKGSESTDAGHAVVALVITAPTDAGVPAEDARLSLALVDKQWKVVGNAP